MNQRPRPQSLSEPLREPVLVLLVPEGQQVSAALLDRLGEHLRRGGRNLRVCFQVDIHRTHRCGYRILGPWTGNRTQLYAVLAELFCELGGALEVEDWNEDD